MGLREGTSEGFLRGVSTPLSGVEFEIESPVRIFFCGGSLVVEKGDDEEEGLLDRFRFENLLGERRSLVEDPGMAEFVSGCRFG